MKSGVETQNRAWKTIALYIALPLAIFAVATSIGFLFQHIHIDDTNIVVVYLLAVLVTAWLTKSFFVGFFSSLLATFLFSYIFAEPRFAFAVDDPNYIITFITMTITALITSTLTSHANRSTKAAKEKEAETKAIYNLTNHLTDAKTIEDIASISTEAISECFNCMAACVCFDESGMPEQSFIQQLKEGHHIRRELENVGDYKHKIEGLRTGFYEGEEFCDWPIYGSEGILGVIRIPVEKSKSMNETQLRLLRAMIESTALAMDRFRSSEQRMLSREEIVKERYRANLLRAISHDLRTPLSGIIGTSEMLMKVSSTLEPQYSLAKDIHSEADWLHSLVENILNLTRLQDGSLALNRQMEAIEEVIGGAISHIEKRSPEHEITVNMPDELILVPIDAKLIEQVLINLLDNATRHTKPGDPISITLEKSLEDNIICIAVKDSGDGISFADLPRIFQMFYTSRHKHADAGQGMGLGLTICETIVKAHGGSIFARNRIDGDGAEFIFSLPLEDLNDGTV